MTGYEGDRLLALPPDRRSSHTPQPLFKMNKDHDNTVTHALPDRFPFPDEKEGNTAAQPRPIFTDFR